MATDPGGHIIIVSNYFGILAPQITGYVVDKVGRRLKVVKALDAEAPLSGVFMTPLSGSSFKPLKGLICLFRA